MNLKLSIPLTFLVLSSMLTGCSQIEDYLRNYTNTKKPRYASSDILQEHPQQPPASLKVVTYNIKYARKIAKAINVLKTHDTLNDADIIFLQEMDLDGVERIARALQMNYIYYPAVLHPINGKDFGNAILSQWPMYNDYKTILPNKNINKRQRIAVSTTVKIGNKEIQAICLHLGIFNRPSERKARIDKILNTIPSHIEHAVVGGDFNTFTKKDHAEILHSFTQREYDWLTDNVGWTNHAWFLIGQNPSLDHIYAKNFEKIKSGKIIDKSASDHIPVWTELKFKSHN